MRLASRQRGRALEMDEPLMLLPILDVERDLKRRRLARRDENALRLLDHVLDTLHLGYGTSSPTMIASSRSS